MINEKEHDIMCQEIEASPSWHLRRIYSGYVWHVFPAGPLTTRVYEIGTGSLCGKWSSASKMPRQVYHMGLATRVFSEQVCHRRVCMVCAARYKELRASQRQGEGK